MKRIYALCLLLILLGFSRSQGTNDTNVTTTATTNTTGTTVIPSGGDNSTANVSNTTTTTTNGTGASNTTVNSTNSTDNGTVTTTNTTVNSTNSTDNGTIVNSTTNSTTNTTTVPDNSTTVNGTNNTNSTSNTSINSLPGGVAVNVSNSSTFPNNTANGSSSSNVTSCDTTCATCSVSNDNMSCTSCLADNFLMGGRCICQGSNTLNCQSQLSAFNGEEVFFMMGNFTTSTINNWGNGTIRTCDNDLPMLAITQLNTSASTSSNITLANALQAHEIAMVSLQINVFLAPMGSINLTLTYDNYTINKTYNSSTVSNLPLQTCLQAGNLQYYPDNIINWTFSSNSTMPNISINVAGDDASSVGIRQLVIQVANCSSACPGMCSGPGDYQCLSCPDGSAPLYGNCLCAPSSPNTTTSGNSQNSTVTISVTNSTNGTDNSTNTTNTTTTNTSVVNGQCMAYNQTGCSVGCAMCSWANGAAECFSCLPNFRMVVFRNITSQWTGVCVPNNTNVNWNMVSPPLCDSSCSQCFGATKYQCSSCADNTSSIVSDGSVGICSVNATSNNASGPANTTNTTNTTTTNTTVVNGTDGNTTNITTVNSTTNSTNGTVNATDNSTDSNLTLGVGDNGCTGSNCTNLTNTTVNQTNGTADNGTDIFLDNATAIGTNGSNTTTVVNTTNVTSNGTAVNTTTNVTTINSTNATNTTVPASSNLTDANGLYYMTNLPACTANMSTSNSTCDILNVNYIKNLTFGHFSKYFAPLHYLYLEATSTQDLCFTCLGVNLTVTSTNGSVFPVKYDALSAPMTGAVKFIFMSNFSIDDVNSWGCNSGVAVGNITVLWCDMSLSFTSLDQQTVLQWYNFTFISYLSYALNVLTNLSAISQVTDVNKIPTRCVSGTCAVNMTASAGLTLCNDSNCTGPRSSNIFGTTSDLIVRQSLDDLPGFSLSLAKVGISLLLTNGSFLMDATNVTTQQQGFGTVTYTIPLSQCANCTGNIMVLIQSHIVSYTAGRRRLNNAPKSPFEGLNRRTQVNIVITQEKLSHIGLISFLIGLAATLVLLAIFLQSKSRKQHEKLQESVTSPSSVEIDPNLPIRV